MNQDEVKGRKRRGVGHGLAFGLLASLLALGHIGLMVSRSEAFVEDMPIVAAALPLPELPPLGETFPDVTPPRSIVTVQSPPQGRLNDSRVTEWTMGTPESVAARGAAAAPSRFHRPEMPFPSKASVGWYLKGLEPGRGIADITFEDRTGDTRRKVVRVKDDGGRPVADLYLRGDSIRIRLPTGSYGLSVAMGRRWEGSETLFGPYGTYFDLQPMDLTMTADQAMYTRVLGAVGRPAPDRDASDAGRIERTGM